MSSRSTGSSQFFRRPKRNPKVIVVGAGPAGAACSLELRRLGAAEVVLIDRSTYPRRKVCGSGLSPFALTQLDELQMLEVMREVHVDMCGLKAVGPGGIAVQLEGSKGAWVVPRSELDNRLVRAAVAEGARMHEGTRVLDVLRGPDRIVRGARTADGELEADIVVVANGSPSTFEIDDRPREGIRTIMGWWQGRLPGNIAVMNWDRRLGGYYAWAFPEPDDIVNVGITIPENYYRAGRLRALFDEILHDHFGDIARANAQVGRWAGHPATVTTRVGRIAESRALFVGEAARLVCPATVEGISFALESGRIAARTIARSFDPARGLSMAGQQRYRFDIGARMLPKFLVGEALYRVMRSPALCRGLSSVVDPRRVASRLAHVVGEHGQAA